MAERTEDPADAAGLERRIRHLAQVLRQVGETLAAQLPEQGGEPMAIDLPPPPTLPVETRPDIALSRLASKLRLARRDRDQSFPVLDLFQDPAWDILLDLFIAHAHDKYISVTNATLSSHVPTTTALRWVWALERAGIIERKPDPDDKRRKFVMLTERGLRYMRNAISAMGERMAPPLYGG